MGQAGQAMARHSFDQRIVFKKVHSEYRRLLQEKGVPLAAEQLCIPAPGA
jgi:hypothetical protein